MRLSKIFECFKGTSRHQSSNADSPRANHDAFALAPSSPAGAGSSASVAPELPPFLPERTSHSASRTPETSESLASTSPNRTENPRAHPIAQFSQTTLPSLWNRAYDVLRDENPELVDQYEKLLSKELLEPTTRANTPQDTSRPDDYADHTENRNRIDSDPEKRQIQLRTITNRGLRRADEKRMMYTIFGHNFVLRDQVVQASRFIQAVKGLVDEAVKVSPEASLVWAGVCVLLPVLTNPSTAEEANREGLSYVTSRIRYYVELERFLWPANLRDPSLKEVFDGHIVDLYYHILDFQINTVLRLYRRWVANAGRDMIRYDNWEEKLNKVREQERIVREASDTLTAITARNALDEIGKASQGHLHVIQSLLSVSKGHWQLSAQHRDISAEQLTELRLQSQILEDRPIDLPVVHEARYDSADVQDSPRCERRTRLRVQETIHHWADHESAEPLFWLVGPAGTGKSTIARTVADVFAKDKRLAAGYFFKRGEQGRNDITRLFPTIAMQLADAIPSFRTRLRRSLNGLDRDAVEKRALEVQFAKLLWDPLRDLQLVHDSELTRIIIIDALDECERPGQLSRVLDLLFKLRELTTIQLRIILTSRFAPEIIGAFEPLLRDKAVRKVALHLEFSEDAKTDIRFFLETRFAEIRTMYNIQQNPWPAAKDLNYLVQLATAPEPLFIYAATLCRYIHDERCRRNPKRQLRLWLENCKGNKSQLDQIYNPILDQAFLAGDQAESEQYLELLGALVLLATPLSAVSLADILCIEIDDINWRLSKLHAVLDVPAEPQSPVRILHKSFSDFLLDTQVTAVTGYHINIEETHAMLATRCIQRMEAGLKRDICNIEKPGMCRDDIAKHVVGLHIPADLRYACMYWTYHLHLSERPLDVCVSSFLYKHLLHWLEALSLLGMLSNGICAIKKLLPYSKHSSSPLTGLREFVMDAVMVVTSFGSIIERAPLQVYGAVLLFSPTTSMVREKLWNQRLPGIVSVQGVKAEWDTHQEIQKGHIGWVTAVAFSPNGRALVSASRDKTVQVWDVSGLHCRTLKGHSDGVRAIACSSDGLLIASASDDRTVRLWDATTGTHLKTLEGHGLAVRAVVFSPNGRSVASASGDETVRLWDIKTGTQQRTFEGHSRGVRAVDFSPNSKLLASASADNTVRLWDVDTGALWKTLEGHTNYVSGVAFAPNGQLIASASGDGTVRLWSALEGTLQQTLEGHCGWVSAVAFAPDSRSVASASSDKTVRLWNTTTGAYEQSLEGHSGWVSAVDFSPDGQLIASAADDMTVRLWDASTGSHKRTLQRRTGGVRALTFSPNRRLVVSTTDEETFQIWDAATGEYRQTIDPGHTTILDLDTSPGVQLLTGPGIAKLCPALVNPTRVTQQAEDEADYRGLSLSQDGAWIMKASERFIWLPSEYRPTAVVTGGCIFFAGCASGQMVRILVEKS